MKLRGKVLLIVGATLVLLLGILYAAARWIVLDGFSDLEQEDGRDNIQSVENAISSEGVRLDSNTRDWAFWDETYAFVGGENPEFASNQLSGDTLANLRINLFLLSDTSGETIYSQLVDLGSGQRVAFPATSLTALLSQHELYTFESTEDGTSGIVVLPEGPMLLAARPVLTNDNEGPIQGSLIMGRYIDAQMLAELEDVTGVSVTAFAPSDDSAPPDVRRASTELDAQTPVVIEALNSEELGGYALLEDVQGNPALIVRILMPRDVFAQGTTTAWYLLGALAMTGTIFVIAMVLLLEGAVVSRLRQLSREVSSVAAQNDPTARVSPRGKDEVADLGDSINSLLENIERSTEERDRAQQQLMAVNRELTEERHRIESLNRSLEAKVADRTSDLETVNEQLRQRNRQLVDARTQAATDALTGLGNHRAFHQRIREAVSGLDRNVGLVILDLDNFKMINDTHGHVAGDDVLRGLAAALMEMGLGEDSYRYGGDEFAVILAGEDQEAVTATAEQVRIAVQTSLDGIGNVTVSVGAASYPENADTAEELIYGADSAMYWAKSAGKNRVGDWAMTRREGTISQPFR